MIADQLQLIRAYCSEIERDLRAALRKNRLLISANATLKAKRDKWQERAIAAGWSPRAEARRRKKEEVP
jgi:hypothetical protein